jgi:hypothetical protein
MFTRNESNQKHRHNLKTHHNNAFDLDLIPTHHKYSKCFMRTEILFKLK